MKSVIDVSALLVSLLVAAGITAALLFAFRGDNRRGAWLAAGAVAAVLIALGAADVLLHTPREQKVSTVILGVALTVLGSLGLVRGTRPLRMWYRAPLVFVVTLFLFLGSLLFAASYVSRLLPF